MEIVCPVCCKVDPPCIEITEHIMVCRCDESGTTFTIQLKSTQGRLHAGECRQDREAARTHLRRADMQDAAALQNICKQKGPDTVTTEP